MTDKVQGFCVMQPKKHLVVQLDLFSWVGDRAEHKVRKFIDVTQMHDWSELYKSCREEIKKRFPKPVQDEEYDDYLQMIEDETALEMAEQFKKIAEQLEKIVLG